MGSLLTLVVILSALAGEVARACDPTVTLGTDSEGLAITTFTCPDGSIASTGTNFTSFCTPTQCQPSPLVAGILAQTGGHHPASAGQTATADTMKNFEGSVNEVAKGSTGSQQASLRDAETASSLGANYSATVGAIFCAEGANKAIADTSLSASDLAACDQHFTAARKLMKAPLQPDANTLATPAAQSTFEEFEKNFGVNRDDYLSRLLAGNGSRASLSELLGSQIPQEKLKAAFEAADALSARPAPDFSVNLAAAGPRTPASAVSVLREKLMSRLETSDTTETPMKIAEPIVDANQDHLEPLARGELVSQDEAADPAANLALTLFDVVHRKYADLLRHHRPR